jgi:hypothetical protein
MYVRWPGCKVTHRVVKRVVRGLGDFLVPHEVRDNDANAPNLVIEHDGSAAVLAAAQLEWTVGVLGVERLTGEALGVGHLGTCDEFPSERERE